jgi:hypothetical protein
MTDDRSNDIARWLDGDMSTEEARAFEAVMEIDPALMQQIETWQRNDNTLREAFPEQPASANLVSLIDNHPALKQKSEVVDFAAARERRDATKPRRTDWRWMGAIAATLVVAVGISTQSNLFSPAASDPVAIALAGTPSGSSVRTTKGDLLTPVLTVPVRGGYCREFVLQGSTGAQDGIACNIDKAGWTVKHLQPGSGAADPHGYEQAGGDDRNAFDAIYRALDARDPLDTAGERAAIARGWKK